MRKIFINILLLTTISISAQAKLFDKKAIKLSTSTLLDKIKGGWAGQVIGVTY
ncbi:MAG: ADP-ribosylglycohydrolase family protein, partial [Stygiobacter sp.]